MNYPELFTYLLIPLSEPLPSHWTEPLLATMRNGLSHEKDIVCFTKLSYIKILLSVHVLRNVDLQNV